MTALRTRATARRLLGGGLLVVLSCSACVRDVERAKRAYVQEGDAYLDHGNIDAAIIEYRNAVQQDPRFASAYRKLSVAYARRGDRADAVRAIQTAAELLPDDVDIAVELANQSLLSGHPDEALPAVSRVLTSDPARAEALLLKVIEADPGQFPAYAMLGRLYLAGNRLEVARTTVEQAVTSKPAVGALTLLGMISQMQNRMPEAQRAFERALEINPRAGVAANNLAWIYAEHGGSLDAALELAGRADVAMPHQPEVRDTLGWIYYRKGMLPQAVATLEQTVQLSPEDPTPAYHLACAYEKSGDRAGARRMFDLYLALDGESERASEVRRRRHAIGD